MPEAFESVAVFLDEAEELDFDREGELFVARRGAFGVEGSAAAFFSRTVASSAVVAGDAASSSGESLCASSRVS